jgi:uncharacterized FAD-dependent dehydrogenase
MLSTSKKKITIVGAGPAGIFTALELSKDPNVEVTILDKGKELKERMKEEYGVNCGWGGAGAFSDGKLTFSTETGGNLRDYLDEKELVRVMNKVDGIFLNYGATDKVYGTEDDEIARIAREAAAAQMRLIPSKVRHLGSDRCPTILGNIRRDLEGKVNILMETEVKQVIVEDQTVKGVLTVGNEVIPSDFVVLAPGRSGADWLKSEAERLKLSSSINPVDLGVRIEVPSEILEPLTSILFEPKLVYYSKSFDDKVRTFCVCPYG